MKYLVVFIMLVLGGMLFTFLPSAIAQGVDDTSALTVGMSWNIQTFTAQDKSTEAEGSIQADPSIPSPFVRYGTSLSFFGDSNFGYNFLFNYGQVQLNRQVLNSPLKTSSEDINTTTSETTTSDDSSNKGVTRNLETEMETQFAYISPVIFYMFGERSSTDYFLVGLGYGLSFLKADGTLYLTENTESFQPDCATNTQNASVLGIQENCEKIEVSHNSLDEGTSGVISLTIEWRLSHFLMTLTGVQVINETQDYTYTLTDGLIGVGISVFL